MTDSKNDEIRSSKIARSKVGARTVLSPGGSITSKDMETLDRIGEDLKEKNQNEVIMDMKNVSFIDSVSLEYLLKMHQGHKDRGCVLKFINVNAICKDIFIATRLINVFHVFDDIHDAIKS